jgi:hypothetical protein
MQATYGEKVRGAQRARTRQKLGITITGFRQFWSISKSANVAQGSRFA